MLAARGWRLSMYAICLAGITVTASESPERSRTGVAGIDPVALGQTSTSIADPDVAATVAHVLSSADHPGLKWGKIPDVAPVLRALYDAEPDRLFWFNGTAPVPRLEATVAALSAAADHGLESSRL